MRIVQISWIEHADSEHHKLPDVACCRLGYCHISTNFSGSWNWSISFSSVDSVHCGCSMWSSATWLFTKSKKALFGLLVVIDSGVIVNLNSCIFHEPIVENLLFLCAIFMFFERIYVPSKLCYTFMIIHLDALYIRKDGFWYLLYSGSINSSQVHSWPKRKQQRDALRWFCGF